MGSKEKIDQQVNGVSEESNPAGLTCGIVMPIASMADYSESHWSDVYNIIKEAVAQTGYEARLVSESKDSTVIPKSIVQNLYDDDIVVCDVSGKNPNVMFELGMRLAFNKPVVLIKDDATGYSFDTSTIEHLTYPRDLRYSEIQKFKDTLASKITATYEASKRQDYRSFLSNFASIKIAHLEHTTLDEAQALEQILNKLDKVENRITSIEAQRSSKHRETLSKYFEDLNIPTASYILYEEPVFKSDTFELLANIQEKVSDLFGKEVKADLVDLRGRVYLRISSLRSPDSQMLHTFQKELRPILKNLNT